MPASLPPKFVDVQSAKSAQGFVNVIGVVMDYLAKYKSTGSSWVITFTIKDSELEGETWTGLKIKYFNDAEHLLPDLQLHDVVLLRGIRIRPQKGVLLGVASQWDRVPWAIFRHSEESESSVSPICSLKSVGPTQEEKAYANALLNLVVQASFAQQQLQEKRPPQKTTDERSTVTEAVSHKGPTGIKKKDKFSLIKDISPGMFVDLIVHVVKTFREQEKFLLYVTDYTVNKALFEYDDQSDDDEEADGRLGDELGYISRRREKRRWNGPSGRMTLQVTLWHPHAYFAQENVQEDRYVYLTNAHIKLGRDHGRVDAALHTDRLYPDKICVRIIDDGDDDPRINELKKRKREYWKRTKPNKAQIAEDFGDARQEGGAKKNAKRRKKEQQQQRKAQGETEITTTLNEIRNKNKPNKHIRATNHAVRCLSIMDILINQTHKNSLPGGLEYRLPFQNLTYRTTVRVVDFFPHKLEDFAVSYNREFQTLPESDGDDRDSDGDESMVNETASQRHRSSWEWRFCLLVEDAKSLPGQSKDRMKLFVWGNEAVYLLKTEAADLREHQDTFYALREKLFLLWGDLEEIKRESPGGRIDLQQQAKLNSLPFTCCVREYGVRCVCDERDKDVMSDQQHHEHGCLGWERRFALHGTTIMK